MKYKSVREQLREQQRKNEALEAELSRTNAKQEYLSMMCDVDIDIEEEGNNAQPEV